ncbi:YdbL family protein [Qipengyuania sediminis]|uniref:YdbL family protein n=1 Tax=Qipengyuania sediminis TaxID=1532023 RepID=UPI00105A48D2|nr:YdbL family protein [Qipengyuania sediminis]
MAKRTILTTLAGALALTALAVPAMAQREPAYAAARAAGKVGERIDGFLGIVGPADAALQALVNDINIRRRALYADRARAANATIDEYALTAGCQAILATRPGEKYQAPDGSWQTRGPGAPIRDSRCP